MCDPIGFGLGFAPNQALPKGYVVTRDYDMDGGTEVYASTLEGEWIGPPAKDRWEARRHAIEHATAARNGEPTP